MENDIISGDSRWLRYPSTHNIQTLNERFVGSSTIKHNNWNENNNLYFLNRDFNVQPSGNNQDANFLPLSYAKIETRLEGFLIGQKGEFQFHDPWFIKSDGSQPGNYWRPCVSSYEPTGNENANEKGVFLDRLFSSGTYYSIKTTSPQDIPLDGQIGTRRFYFQNWSGTNVQFENGNSLQTGVVFTNEPATATAVLKGQLMSSDQNGISSNSQRKIVRTDNSIYHVVYESLGQIWYTHSLTSDYYGSWVGRL